MLKLLLIESLNECFSEPSGFLDQIFL